MNKEQKELLNEAYENYKTIHKHAIRTEGDRNQFAIESLIKQLIYPQEEFINKCKTDPEFSEKWGLKIEERELSLEERGELDSKKDNVRNTWGQTIQTFTPTEVRTWLNEKNIPTRLITITYNDKTIESYE